MVPHKKVFPLGLTFNDILLLPHYTDFSRSDIQLSTQATKNITLKIPLISSPMDTVTESKLAIELAKIGGLGIIHRNLPISKQAAEVAKVKKQKLLVGAAIGASAGFEERAQALIQAGADCILIDSAHGYSKNVIDTLVYLKNKYKKVDAIAGSIATYDGAKTLISKGADALRVGMGPGAICTTRIISGMGVPQVTAILETTRAAKLSKIPVIADGGINYSGDIVKALALGASTVMMGSFFAQTEESPGKIVYLNAADVPKRFKNILTHAKRYKFKEYRGMGSVGAMKEGARIKSEDEFHGKSYKDRTLVAEGVEGYVPVRGKVADIVEQTIGGINSGFFYVGAKTIPELWKNAECIQITQASLTESHPHDILVTNSGKNYA
jgi:IMP dehydrogenase